MAITFATSLGSALVILVITAVIDRLYVIEVVAGFLVVLGFFGSTGLMGIVLGNHRDLRDVLIGSYFAKLGLLALSGLGLAAIDGFNRNVFGLVVCIQAVMYLAIQTFVIVTRTQTTSPQPCGMDENWVKDPASE